MGSAIGWLLDVTVEQNAATLWIKLKQGGILRLVDKYQPSLYILPRNEQAGTELFLVPEPAAVFHVILLAFYFERREKVQKANWSIFIRNNLLNPLHYSIA